MGLSHLNREPSQQRQLCQQLANAHPTLPIGIPRLQESLRSALETVCKLALPKLRQEVIKERQMVQQDLAMLAFSPEPSKELLSHIPHACALAARTDPRDPLWGCRTRCRTEPYGDAMGKWREAASLWGCHGEVAAEPYGDATGKWRLSYACCWAPLLWDDTLRARWVSLQRDAIAVLHELKVRCGFERPKLGEEASRGQVRDEARVGDLISSQHVEVEQHLQKVSREVSDMSDADIHARLESKAVQKWTKELDIGDVCRSMAFERLAPPAPRRDAERCQCAMNELRHARSSIPTPPC